MATEDNDADVNDQLMADVFQKKCTSRAVLQNVTGRWGTLALLALAECPYRFSSLRRKVDGVSERMLSQTLQALERDGMVHREVLGTIPPKVEYRITELGAEVATRLLSVVEFVESKMPEITEHQRHYSR